MTADSSNIFSQTSESAPETQVTAPAAGITLPPEVSELVGQGKKYASVDEALKSVPHAQNHIRTLTEELQAAKTELEKRKTAEQILDEIKSGNTTQGQPPSSSVTPDNVSQLVAQVLQAEKAKEVATKNVTSVSNAFVEKFGPKAEEMYNAIAKEAGLTVPMLNNLAATSPHAVLTLAGLKNPKAEGNAGKITSSTNTSALESNNTSGNDTTTSRLRQGASTKELVSAWRVAGQKVGKQS